MQLQVQLTANTVIRDAMKVSEYSNISPERFSSIFLERF